MKTIETQKSHPITLRRVLYIKVLRWLDRAGPQKLRSAGKRLAVIILVGLAIFAPQFLLGMLAAALGNTRFVLFASALLALTYWRLAVRSLRKWKRRGNQHTYHGLPVDELATYLTEHGFKREAMRDLGISRDKYDAIAQELEGHQLLVRGENNARVLNTIDRQQIVRQLRDDFPLAFRDGEWVERKGSYELYLRDKERREQKEREKVERLERRAKRAKQQISEAQEAGFITRELAV